MRLMRSATAAITWAGAVLGIFLFAEEVVAEQKLQAHFINVGKGDATLIEFPCGTVLFDAGGGEGSEEVLTGYLDDYFEARPQLERRIDLMVLSHGHLDHTRNMKPVIEQYDVKTLLTNDHKNKKGFKTLYGLLASHPDVNHRKVDNEDIPAKGQVLKKFKGLGCEGGPKADLRLLWGDARPRPKDWGDNAYKDENNHSVALVVNWGQTRILLTGDLERDALRTMLEKHKRQLSDVDIYQISHHGFRSGTLPEFEEHINPRIAILSRPADRAWHAPTMARFDDLVRMKREPVEIPVWAFEKSEASAVASMDDSMDEAYDLGGKGKNTRVPGGAVLTAAVYWTGRDGNIVVELSPDGELKLATE